MSRDVQVTCAEHSYEEVDDLVWVCTRCGHVLPAQTLVGEINAANIHVHENFDTHASNKYGLDRSSVNRLNAPSIVEELCHRLNVHDRNVIEQTVSLMEQYESECSLLRASRILQSLIWFKAMRSFVDAGDKVCGRGGQSEEDNSLEMRKEWENVKELVLGRMSCCQAFLRSVPRLNAALIKEEELRARSFTDPSYSKMSHAKSSESDLEGLSRRYARRLLKDISEHSSAVLQKFLDCHHKEIIQKIANEGQLSDEEISSTREHLKIHPSLSIKLQDLLASSADSGTFPNYIDHTRLFRWSADRSVIERVAAAVLYLLLRKGKQKPFLQEVAASLSTSRANDRDKKQINNLVEHIGRLCPVKDAVPWLRASEFSSTLEQTLQQLKNCWRVQPSGEGGLDTSVLLQQESVRKIERCSSDLLLILEAANRMHGRYPQTVIGGILSFACGVVCSDSRDLARVRADIANLVGIKKSTIESRNREICTFLVSQSKDLPFGVEGKNLYVHAEAVLDHLKRKMTQGSKFLANTPKHAGSLQQESVVRVAQWIRQLVEDRASKTVTREDLSEEDHRALEVFKAGLRYGCHVSKIERECLDGSFVNSDWWLRSTGIMPKRKVGEGEELTAQDVSDDDLEPGGIYLYSAEEVAVREQQLQLEEEEEEEEEDMREEKVVKPSPPRKRIRRAKREEMGTRLGRSAKVNYEALEKLLKEFS